MSGVVKLKSLTAAELIARKFPRRETIIEPWLRSEETAIIWAASGVGKTMLCLSLALAVAGGGAVEDWKAPEARKVLYIDGEMNLRDIQERIAMLLSCGAVRVPDREEALGNLEIIARQDQEPGSPFLDITDPESQAWVLRKVKAESIELVILDNLTTLSDGLSQENEAGEFKPLQGFFMSLKQAKVASILVHHANKTGKGMRGSTSLETTFEVILGLTKPLISRPGQAGFVTEFSKYRSKGNSSLAKRSWTLEDQGWIVTEATPDGPEEDAVLQALKSLRFTSQAEIAKALGIDRATVGRRLKAAMGRGWITQGEIDEALRSARKLKEEPSEPLDDDSLESLRGAF